RQMEHRAEQPQQPRAAGMAFQQRQAGQQNFRDHLAAAQRRKGRPVHFAHASKRPSPRRTSLPQPQATAVGFARPPSNPADPERSRARAIAALPAKMATTYWLAAAFVGVQNSSKARVRTAAIVNGSLLSMSRRSIMKASLPSRMSAMEGDDGG